MSSMHTGTRAAPGEPSADTLPSEECVSDVQPSADDVLADRITQLSHALTEQAEQIRAIQHAALIEPICVGTVEAARLLGVSRSFLCKLSSSGMCPAPVHLGERTLWWVAELREWIAAGVPPREQWEQMKAARKK